MEDKTAGTHLGFIKILTVLFLVPFFSAMGFYVIKNIMEIDCHVGLLLRGSRICGMRSSHDWETYPFIFGVPLGFFLTWLVLKNYKIPLLRWLVVVSIIGAMGLIGKYSSKFKNEDKKLPAVSAMSDNFTYGT